RRHTRFSRDWSSDVCSSDLHGGRSHVQLRGSGARMMGAVLPSRLEPVRKDLAMDQGPEIREQFIHAMSGVFSSVSIVATGRGSNRLAVTASAVSSVSADPPMLLVCLQRRSPVCSAITMNGHFSLNILAEDQEEQSQIFSGRCPAHLAYKFNDRDWEQVPPGLPVLKGSVANFVCRLHQFI